MIIFKRSLNNCKRIDNFDEAEEYALARRQQWPPTYNDRRRVEQPIPNFEITDPNEHQRADSGDQDGLDDDDEQERIIADLLLADALEDPLDCNMKIEQLEEVRINASDRNELNGLLSDDNPSNDDISAVSLDCGNATEPVVNVGQLPIDVIQNHDNTNEHANGASIRSSDERTDDVVDSSSVVEPASANGNEIDTTQNVDVGHGALDHNAHEVNEVNTMHEPSSSTSTSFCDAANVLNELCDSDDDDVELCSEYTSIAMPKPMACMPDQLLKRENDDISGSLPFKINVSCN